MCAVVGAVLTALAGIATAAQQASNQQKNYNYQDRVARQTEANAAKAADADYLATAERINQVRQSTAQEAFEASRETDKALSTLTAGAEFSGLAGGSVDDLRFSIASRAADNEAMRIRNASWEEQQIMRSMDSIAAQQQSRLNAVTPSPVQGIDYAQLLGTLGQAGAQGYRAYNS